jgi:hypothetical protein
MQFLNGTNLDDFINRDVQVILTSNSNVCDTLPLCRAFLRDGRLWIDLIPQLNQKYAVEVPDDSIFSKNEADLSMGRYGIIIRAETQSGLFIRDLLEQKRRYQEKTK